MRHTSQLLLTFVGEPQFRAPSFWDKVSRFFGGNPDLRSGRELLTRSALAVADDVTRAFAMAGVDDAITLLVDADVVYQDLSNVPHDAPRLLEAVHRTPEKFAASFETLRAVFAHEADGMHFIVEASFHASFEQGEPAADFAVSARSGALRPLQGETIEQAKARIEAALSQSEGLTADRATFDAFVGRLADAVRAVFVDGRLEVREPSPQVFKPAMASMQSLASTPLTSAGLTLRSAPPVVAPRSYGLYYDPWRVYYDDPVDTWVQLMVLDWAMRRPFASYGYGYGFGAPVVVVHEYGDPIGELSHLDAVGPALGGVDEAVSHDWNDTTTTADLDWSSSFADPVAESIASGGSDCTSSDCSGSSDCTSDCGSSDCTSDCASSDCSSDCASSDCSSDCASSDCSSDCGGGDW
jgi:hypothetical protein